MHEFVKVDRIDVTINFIFSQEDLSMKVSEAVTILQDIKTKLVKAKQEIIGKIDALQAALADVDLPVAAAQTLGEIGDAAQALDDIVPDVPAEPNPEQPIEPTPEQPA